VVFSDLLEESTCGFLGEDLGSELFLSF